MRENLKLNDRNYLKYWIWLTQIPYVGPVMTGRLLAEFKTPQAIYEAKEECLKQISGITKRQIASILTARSFEQAEKVLEDCNRKNISILTKEDERYPIRVKMIKDSPAVFYYQGMFLDHRKSSNNQNNSHNPNKTVGIVGARRCTQEAKKYCAEITCECIANGEIVISGMAKGIDACAGTVCINSGAYTIAIVGNGLDICYPVEHEHLMERIKEKGLVLSEYPPGTEPSSYTFPQRNRLIAAWSDRLIVIAAGRGSGAMITADYARKYGREVNFY